MNMIEGTWIAVYEKWPRSANIASEPAKCCNPHFKQEPLFSYSYSSYYYYITPISKWPKTPENICCSSLRQLIVKFYFQTTISSADSTICNEITNFLKAYARLGSLWVETWCTITVSLIDYLNVSTSLPCKNTFWSLYNGVNTFY